jgi:DNA-binding PadR family transcriptional regulator
MINLTAQEEDFVRAVAHGGDLTAYEVKEVFELATQGEVEVSLGTLYTTLKRLEDKGLLVSRWATPPSSPPNAQPRRFYGLSKGGFEYLSARDRRRQQLATLGELKTNYESTDV